MIKSVNGMMPTIYASKFASFKYGTKKVADLSAGAGWFHMQPATMTDSLKTDLAVIRHRTYLDPKRFYKKSDKSNGKVLQVGTVVEGAAEFYRSRLVNKDRRQTLTAEIMADPGTANYAKRKFKKMQQDKSEAGQKNKGRKPKKQMRRGF
jgi:Fcf2 pre-rRNA processing